jgi:hypothetical protein
MSGKYFVAMSFTFDVPFGHNLDEELLEHLMMQVHEPTSDLMLCEYDHVVVDEIVDEGRVTAFSARISGLVSYKLTPKRIARVEQYVEEVTEVLRSTLAGKRHTVTPYLAFHKE